jgi:hypothetical protein
MANVQENEILHYFLFRQNMWTIDYSLSFDLPKNLKELRHLMPKVIEKTKRGWIEQSPPSLLRWNNLVFFSFSSFDMIPKKMLTTKQNCQSHSQMFIPLAPQTSRKGRPNYFSCLQTHGFVYTLRMNILTCAQPKITEGWMTLQNRISNSSNNF